MRHGFTCASAAICQASRPCPRPPTPNSLTSPSQELFTPTTSDWLLRVALGLGDTRHAPLPAEGEVGRKGISHERTFK